MMKQSYTCGTNQALNFVFGSALVGWANHHVTNNMWWCLAAATIAFLFWQIWQFKFRQATIADYVSDTVYWFSGALVWAMLIEYSEVRGVGVMYPTLVLCVWILEHKRLTTCGRILKN